MLIFLMLILNFSIKIKIFISILIFKNMDTLSNAEVEKYLKADLFEELKMEALSPEERAAYRAALAEEFRFPSDSILIGNLAALVPHKDHDTLLAAAVIVLLQRPQVKFLIAGRGPEETNLFESIRRMGLLGKVILLGHRDDPVPLLKALDIYVQSSWGEGMGSVLIEAAACGVPIAATTAGGIPEVVTDGETGLLVVPRHPEALAAILMRLIDDKDLRARLAAEARKGVSRFGLTRMANDMEAIYDSLS